MTTETEQLRQRIAELERTAEEVHAARKVLAEHDKLLVRIAELEAQVAKKDEALSAIDKLLRCNVNDPDPLPAMFPASAQFVTTHGLVAGLIRERDSLKAQVQQAADAARRECAKIAWNHEPDINGPIETAILAKIGQPVARDKDAERFDWLVKNKHLDAWWSVGGVKDREQNIRDDIDEAMQESSPSQKGDN